MPHAHFKMSEHEGAWYSRLRPAKPLSKVPLHGSQLSPWPLPLTTPSWQLTSVWQSPSAQSSVRFGVSNNGRAHFANASFGWASSEFGSLRKIASPSLLLLVAMQISQAINWIHTLIANKVNVPTRTKTEPKIVVRHFQTSTTHVATRRHFTLSAGVGTVILRHFPSSQQQMAIRTDASPLA